MSERSETDVQTRKELEMFYNDPDWFVDEEESRDKRIQKLLKSKRLTGNSGFPDFIAVHKKRPIVVVVENKKEPNRHESSNHDEPVKYAVDGALHYASTLKKEVDVIAVGCSGQPGRNGDVGTYKADSYLCRKGENKPEFLAHKILNPDDYLSIIDRNFEKLDEIKDKLKGFSRKYHNDLRDYAKLLEEKKPVFVGAILTALQDSAFCSSFSEYRGRPTDLAEAVVQSLDRVWRNTTKDEEKRRTILQATSFITVEPTFKEPNVLLDLIADLHEFVYPLTQNDCAHIDMLTEFYREFIRYSGGDKKGLGIVMTPPHICDLFARLANLHEGSKILDICMGTAGFLVAGLTFAKEIFGNDINGLTEFQRNNLVGVEQQANMFNLSCTNMLLRKCNIDNFYLEDCFNLKDQLKQQKCNVGFLNPPYSQKGDELKELNFISYMMDSLTEGSLGFAIVPISCAHKKEKVLDALREGLLKKHTLVASMSMPDVFSPVGNVPCVLVFKAHVPHNSEIETWFGNWKDDGFIKIKKEGRVDYYGKWEEIKSKWVDMFLNQKVIHGVSTKQKIALKDEWCVEAYIETDYSDTIQNDFIDNIKSYMAFILLTQPDNLNSSEFMSSYDISPQLNPSKWLPFRLDELFDLKKGKRITSKDFDEGDTPYVTATAKNNGVSNYIDVAPIHRANTITVSYDGSVGEAFYQPLDCYVLDSVNVLYPKFQLNRYIAMFLITIIKKEKPKFNFGRKWKMKRMAATEIFLPVTDDGKPDWEFMENYTKPLFKKILEQFNS